MTTLPELEPCRWTLPRALDARVMQMPDRPFLTTKGACAARSPRSRRSTSSRTSCSCCRITWCPGYLETIPALPRTLTNKVRKAELRSGAIAGDCWERKAAGLSLLDVARRVQGALRHPEDTR